MVRIQEISDMERREEEVGELIETVGGVDANDTRTGV